MAVANVDRTLQVRHLDKYDKELVKPMASSMLTIATAVADLQQTTSDHTRQIGNLDPNSGELALPINPDPEPTQPGSIWIVTED